VLNSPATIDQDYRGELQVILANFGREVFHVIPNARIAQFVVCPVARVELVEVAELRRSGRGANGMGSTGVE